MNTETLKEFIALKKQIKEIEIQLEPLKNAIFEEMKQQKIAELPTSEGTFRVKIKQSWKYPNEIKQQIEAIYAQIQMDGKAQLKITEYLDFRQ